MLSPESDNVDACGQTVSWNRRGAGPSTLGHFPLPQGFTTAGAANALRRPPGSRVQGSVVAATTVSGSSAGSHKRLDGRPPGRPRMFRDQPGPQRALSAKRGRVVVGLAANASHQKGEPRT